MVIQLQFDLLDMLSGPSHEKCFSFFIFFNKIHDGRRITCYFQELACMLHRFVLRKQLSLAICCLDFGVILTSHFHVVSLKFGDNTVFLYN